MAWYPEPWEVVKQQASGLENMATLSDQNPSPAFGHHLPYVLLYVRAWFTAGTGQADLSVNQRVIYGNTDWYDKPLRVLENGGSTYRFLDFRVQADELYHWTFVPEIRIVPTWTNPDSGTMRWALEVGMAPFPEGVL